MRRVMSEWRKLAVFCMAAGFTLAMAGPAGAQQSGNAEPPFAAPSLRQLTRQAGYIFAGTVTKVEPGVVSAPNEVVTVRITFRVEQAIRGVRTGETLQIRQWAGLWNSGERYRVGERLMLFLYPPSKLGLTSPVGGALGRLEMNSQGEFLLGSAQLRALLPGISSAGDARTGRMDSHEFLRAVRREFEEP
jgi:hypothetical protein